MFYQVLRPLSSVSDFDEADDSEATMAEMRFYLHSRLGPQAHNLHASWGASSINDLNATRLRHLCALVLQHE